MAQLDLAISRRHVCSPDGRLEPAHVGVRDGRIASITDQALDADETLDVDGLTVAARADRRALPRLLGLRLGDLPGRDARGGEGRHHDRRRHAARQAAATLTAAAPAGEARARALRVPRRLRAVRRLSERGPRRGRGARRGRHRRAQALHRRRRAAGDVPRGRHRADARLPCAGRTRRASTVVVHCENAEIVDFETARLQAEGRTGAEAWDEARPWYSEVEAVQRVALAAEVTGCRTVIAHVTAPQSVERCATLRARGADVWVETCPHYLCLTTRRHGADGRLKWNPPSRNPESVERLWELLRGRPRAHDRLRPRAARRSSPAPTSGRSSRAPATASSRCCPSSPPRRRGAASRSPQVVDLLSTTPARALRPLPAQGHDRGGRRRRLLPSLETNGRRTLDAQELEYHEQEKWSPLRRARGDRLPGLHRPARPA